MTPMEAIAAGVTLREALEKFGKLRKFNSRPYSPPYPIDNPREPRPEELPHLLGNLADIIFEPGRHRFAAAEEIKRLLANGKLLGVGYVSPRLVTDAPTSIPSDLWPLAKLNYDKSEIESGSLKFENVRIIKPPKNARIVAPPALRLISSTDNIGFPRPKGRPSTRATIFAAYEKLKNAGKIDFTAPMTHAYPKIRAFLIQQHGTEKGFQNEAMRLAIKDDFQATVSTSKSAHKL